MSAGMKARAGRLPVRVVFITYLLVIVAGLTYFTVIGLTHH